METNPHSIIKIFQKYANRALTEEEIRQAITDTLELPWIRRLQVFADQALFLIDLNNFKYLYVSPAVENILGYPPEAFADFHFTASLMSTAQSQTNSCHLLLH